MQAMKIIGSDGSIKLHFMPQVEGDECQQTYLFDGQKLVKALTFGSYDSEDIPVELSTEQEKMLCDIVRGIRAMETIQQTFVLLPAVPLRSSTRESFTERAQNVMNLAEQEAARLKHPYVFEEHILIGLIVEPGVSNIILGKMGLDEAKIRAGLNLQPEPEVAVRPETGLLTIIGNFFGLNQNQPEPGSLTTGAKLVVNIACHEAICLGHNCIGTEHLLLGLVRNPRSLAVKTLCQLTGLKAAELYKQTLQNIEEYVGGR